MEQYDHKNIEKKWQAKWEEEGVYKTKDDPKLPKQFILDMFPYPSGEGLHVGHPRGYLATDVYSRMKRMMGFNVLHPMGWDAFGLPAENYAIKNKVHPRVAVEKNIERFKSQLSIMGVDYDWSSEVNTTDPKFYKWTQWIFLQMYKKGLAYESNEPVNWCPVDKTVLANEDVESDGTCERCGAKVEKKPMRQWVLKITDYADRMLEDLDKLSKWPEGVKEAQRNWIGRSEGSEIEFKLSFSPPKLGGVDQQGRGGTDSTTPQSLPNLGGEEDFIKVFTTRADTLFGVTYVVLAPENPILSNLKSKISNLSEVEKYIEDVKNKSELERQQSKEKTGVELKGVKAINPANGEEVPVWVADYVLAGYGTGAVMAVPAHDERDFEFAKKYNLPIKEVVLKIAVPKDNYETSKNIAAFGIITRQEDNKILLQFEVNLNQWRLPGGSLEKHESPEDGVLREIKEETGYSEGRVIKVLGSTYVCFERLTGKKGMVERRAYGLVVDVTDSKIVDPVLTDEEAAAELRHEWMDPKKAIELLKSNRVLMGESEIVERYISNTSLFIEDGILVDSGKFDGLTSLEARQKITEAVGGKIMKTYRLKDWVFSRQRYWGEPIPMIHCEKCGVVSVPEKDLPVLLPEVENYEPTGTGESPLANISDWVNVKCPNCEGSAKRETNTMPQWAGSSWYYLRYIDPKNSIDLVDPVKEKNWMPVDVYVGGDHATRHLIYARFWHKFLFDIGKVSTEEPFPRLEFLGFILAEDGKKMSKRWKNIVNPDEMIERFGADAFRLYEMFIGPFESTVPWNTDGMVGTTRFVEKVWKIGQSVIANPEKITDNATLISINKTIKKVTEDIEAFKFNTAVSTLMICANQLEKSKSVGIEDFKKFLQILAPFAPHISEELWSNVKGQLSNVPSIHLSSWPQFDPSKIIDTEATIAIQVNGKVRGELAISTDISETEIKEKALAHDKIKPYIDGKEIKKFIYIKNKLVSIVVQ